MFVSIDGHQRYRAVVRNVAPINDALLFEISGLPDTNHVLELSPCDGWAIATYLMVTSGSQDSNSAATEPTSGRQGGKHHDAGSLALVDRMSDLSHIFSRSADWGIDDTNAHYFNGVPTRLTRQRNADEFIQYRCVNVSSFHVRLYTKSLRTLQQRLHIYTSNASNNSVDPVSYTIESPVNGGSDGEWTRVDLAPVDFLPQNRDFLSFVVSPGDVPAYDPEFSEISLSSGG